MPHPLACLLALLILVVSTAPTRADEAGPRLAGLAVFEDKAGVETIDRVAVLSPDKFRPLADSLAAGYTRSVHWLRFTVTAPAGEWWLDILPPYLDDLRLYVPTPDHPGDFLERRAGDRLPFAAREVPYRGFVFKLDHDDSQPRTYFLRVQTSSTSLVVPRLWAPQQFLAAVAAEYGLLMGLIGVLLVVAVLAAVSWHLMREPIYPRFILYLLTLVLVFVGNGGFAAQYLLPDFPPGTDSWVGVAAMVNVAAGAALYRQILQVGPTQRLAHRLFQAAFWLPLLGLAATALGYFTEAMRLVNLVLLLTVLLGWRLAIDLLMRRVPGSGLLFAAISFSLLGVLSSVLQILGLVSGHFLQLHSLNITALGAVLTMHLAIGVRYRVLREERQQALEAASRERQIRRQQGQFLEMLSHELKTPLAMIDAAVQSLQALVPAAPEVNRRHDRIRRAVGRINGLVEKFLHQDQLDGPDPVLRRDPVDFGDLLRDAVAGFAQPPGRLVLEAAPCRKVAGDERLLQVLFTNLIDNALKYSPRPAPVQVSMAEAGDRLVVEVRDHGAGIPVALRDRVFDRYVRGDGIGDIPGVGLGLHLVRTIAERLGGTVELLDPAQGSGTLFRVSLPLEDAAA